MVQRELGDDPFRETLICKFQVSFLQCTLDLPPTQDAIVTTRIIRVLGSEQTLYLPLEYLGGGVNPSHITQLYWDYIGIIWGIKS